MQEDDARRIGRSTRAVAAIALSLLMVGHPAGQGAPPPKEWTTAQDHQHMMEQLGIKALRPGPSGNPQAPNSANYDEALANPFPKLAAALVTFRPFRSVKAIVDTCRRKAPQATIVLTGILPRNGSMSVMPEIRRINENLARFADGRTVRYVDLAGRLADGNGRLLDGMMNRDGLHPSVPGYQVWADALKPLLAELLGPPAAVDLAPPPTGDPSARGPI